MADLVISTWSLVVRLWSRAAANQLSADIGRTTVDGCAAGWRECQQHFRRCPRQCRAHGRYWRERGDHERDCDRQGWGERAGGAEWRVSGVVSASGGWGLGVRGRGCAYLPTLKPPTPIPRNKKCP